MNKEHEGSALEDFLAGEGMLEKCTETAMQRIRDWQSGHPEKTGVDSQGENHERR